MKEQYIGDINDYRKYALLRALSADGRQKVGVCWMLTPSDGRNDGNFLAYLKRPGEFRRHDPDLFDLLARLAGDFTTRRLIEIESSGIIAGAKYFNAETPQDRVRREAYFLECAVAFADRDLVFFDPDNGLDVLSIPKGRKDSPKFVFLDEVEGFYAAGKSILIYQHFPRVQRDAFAASCATRLKTVAPGAEIWRFATSHVLFLLLIHPDAPSSLTEALHDASGRWDPSFMSASKLVAP